MTSVYMYKEGYYSWIWRLHISKTYLCSSFHNYNIAISKLLPVHKVLIRYENVK